MPIYELVVAIQKLEQEALKGALKRAAGYIFEQDGIIRSIENLGYRNLPYFIKTKGKRHYAANFFIFNYDMGMSKPREVLGKLKLDLDIVRATNFKCARGPLELHKTKEQPECTLHTDLLPPPFRPTVMALQEMGRKKKERFVGKNVNDSDFII